MCQLLAGNIPFWEMDRNHFVPIDVGDERIPIERKRLNRTK
jgi:hypothetical protein